MPCWRAIPAISRSGSIAPVLTLPALATIAIGVLPAGLVSLNSVLEFSEVNLKTSIGWDDTKVLPSNPKKCDALGDRHVNFFGCVDYSLRLAGQSQLVRRH